LDVFHFQRDRREKKNEDITESYVSKLKKTDFLLCEKKAVETY